MLLAPKSTEYPYYAEFGWIGPANVPDDQTVVDADAAAARLSPGHPVTLTWDNGQGLIFTRVIAVDDQYMFTVDDSVANKSGQAQTLYPFAYVAREGVPKEQTSWVLHQGFVGVANGSETTPNIPTSRMTARRPRPSPPPAAGSASPTNTGWRRSIPPQGENFNGAYLGSTTTRRRQGLSGQLPPGRAHHRAGRAAPGHPPAVRRRQGGGHSARL